MVPSWTWRLGEGAEHWGDKWFNSVWAERRLKSLEERFDRMVGPGLRSGKSPWRWSAEAARTMSGSAVQAYRLPTHGARHAGKLISADNHIDLTYCPPDSGPQAPANGRKAPRVEERNDGLHWFVDGQDSGMWNGVGPGFLTYNKGSFHHVDEMKDVGFEWDLSRRQAPPDHPGAARHRSRQGRARQEIIYGCLMVNDLIDDTELRDWADALYIDWVADFAKRADPNRVFPLAIIPNSDPKAAAAEVRRCAKMGLSGGDLAFKRMRPPL